MKRKILLCFFLLLLLLTACRDKNQPQLSDDMTLSLYMAETGEVTEIPLEEYLYGVVAAEMDVNWPKEALAAQAILARTFTLEKVQAGGVKEHGTDASTDIREFQAYNADKINDNVRQAVDDTKGEVVTYHNKLIKAWFFADAGGMTASSAEEGLSYNKTKTPYIHSVEDPGDDLSDNENRFWEASFAKDEVIRALKDCGITPPEKIDAVKISAYGASGRAVTLDFSGAEVSAVAFRLAIGSEKMKSTMLENIKIQDGTLYLAGRGYGHGVGMSQWGARALAEQGKSAEEIIGYFFKDIEINDLSEL